MRVAKRHSADTIFTSADVTRYAQRREARLEQACQEERLSLQRRPSVTVVAPGAIRPAGADHYRVFTPYWNAWCAASWRRPVASPRRIRVPSSMRAGTIPRLDQLVDGAPSPDLSAGGEEAGRELLRRFTARTLATYSDTHDDLAGDATCRISPHVHFGCVSPLELATRVHDRAGDSVYLRQLCWRDFHHQVTHAFERSRRADYRSRGDRWRRSAHDLDAWRSGRTGYPIVDAGMRQLQREGWMHNRARLIVASFLVKDLYLDWRAGAQHFLDWLVDGDIANNSGNWQWVAGTGNDTRPNRVFNPVRQADRFDPDGDYVRRYVTELACVEGAAAHRPWRLLTRTRHARLSRANR